MSKRVCPEPGCGTLTDGGRCRDHAREQDKARGTSNERGYDHAHRQERAKWKRIVDKTGWPCGRCDERIQPGDAFDLDHTDDRSGYLGPSHVACNRRAPRLK